jgi:cobalt-zinc-cadmium resistance protein CzcA
MIEKILDLSVRHRWFVVLLTAIACALGVWSLNKLPIDAVPDVTNNQVQINAIAPALTPVEMEKQITFQIENILAGTPTHPLILPQRLCPGNGGVPRQHQHLLRAAAGE